MLFLNNNLKIFSLFIITFTVVIKYPYCQQQFSFNFSKFPTTPMIYVTLLNNQVIAPLILGRPTLVSFFPLSNSSSLLPTSQIIRFKILTRIVTWLPPLPMASRHLLSFLGPAAGGSNWGQYVQINIKNLSCIWLMFFGIVLIFISKKWKLRKIWK